MTTLDEFNRWLSQPEGSHLEFKEAKSQYDMKDILDYCTALANEGGGKLVLGVNEQSRKVTGTRAFSETHQTLSHDIFQKTEPHLRVDVEVLQHPDGRVLIFHASARPGGCPIRSGGEYAYPMRLGESLKEMDNETLRKIHAEIEEDFSARIVPGLSIENLDEKAVEVLRKRRAKKAGWPEIANQGLEKALRDLQLFTDEGMAFATLVLLGKAEKIALLLPQAEIIYEWRGDPRKISYDFRREWKEPYLAAADDIWETINARNIRTPYQQGFDVPLEIPAFDENSCREAINNAVAHRDYSRTGSAIFIRCSPRSFSIVSPGGFPEGVTPENALDRSEWRNRRIADTLQHLGLVEQSGQGLDRIFEATIRHGKGMPDFAGTDEHEVHLNIPAQVGDPTFVRYLEKVANERQITFGIEELLELEHIRTQRKISSPAHRKKFLELGLIEQIDRAKGARYVLSQQYYEHIGRRGIHTRETGLSRDAKKQLILEHLQRHGRVQRQELLDAFPEVFPQKLSNIMQSLKMLGLVTRAGPRKTGYWLLSKLDLNKSKIEAKDQVSGFHKPK